MSEPCNSRPFSCLMKSCFPNPNTATQPTATATTTLSSLPDDLVLHIISLIPISALPQISLVSKRFLQLSLLNRITRPTIFSLSSTLLFVSPSPFSHSKQLPISINNNMQQHARLISLHQTIFIITPNSTTRFNTQTRKISYNNSTMLHPRTKFAIATINARIYITGGGGTRSETVEEYNPDEDSWRVVANTPRRRYGCVGAAVGDLFFIIGGLKLGEPPRAAYASSMDLYDVKGRVWLRSRALPCGGCVVGACAVGECVFVLASHAVELSFWRFNACVGSGSFGVWTRVNNPPLGGQVRLDSAVRFSCVGVESEKKVVLIVQQRKQRGLVLVYDTLVGEWSRVADLPEAVRRAACVCVEC